MKDVIRANTTIDTLRILLILGVIAVHTVGIIDRGLLTGSSNDILEVIMTPTLLAIPLFYAITGYFSFQIGSGEAEDKKRISRIWKLVKIFLWAELLFVFLSVFMVGAPSVLTGFTGGKDIMNFISDATPFPTAFNSFLLYYILTIILVSVVDMGIGKHRDRVLAILAGVIFVIAGMSVYLSQIRGYSAISPYLGYGDMHIMGGIMYYSIGYFIRKYQDKIFRIKTLYLALGLVIAAALFLLEKTYAAQYGVSAPIVTAMILVLCIKHGKLFAKKLKFLPALGNRYTLYIYLFHPLMLWVLSTYILTNIRPIGVLTWIACAVGIYISTLVLSFVFIKTRDVSIRGLKRLVRRSH